MNESEIRIVDPILSTQSRGYRNAESVGHHLMPFASVAQMAGKRIEFGKESFKKQSTVRAPGADTKEIQFGFEGKPFALEQHRVAHKAPKEHTRAAGVPGVKILARGVNLVQDQQALELEVAIAELATDPANYAASNKITLSGTDQFTHDDSVPQDIIDDAKEAVRAKIGREPNTMEIPAKVYRALKKNKHVKSHFTSSLSPNPTINVMKLQEYFDIEKIVVGKKTYVDGNGDFQDVWGTAIVLAYVPATEGEGDHNVPSYGYTYRLTGNPVVEQTYWSKGNQSWLTPYEDNYGPQMVGPESGYLIEGAI